MTIDEAIEELEDGLRGLRGYLNKDYDNAIQLGIEALKRIKEARGFYLSKSEALLPGETEK